MPSVDFAEFGEIYQSYQRETLLPPNIMTYHTQKPVGFLCENNGNKSLIRLISLMCVLAAIGFGIVAVLKPSSEATGTNLTMIFLTAGIGGKVTQKFAETPTVDQG